MGRIRRASARVERLESELAGARRDYWRAIAEANASGITLAAIGRELGVSRQRVAEMIERAG